MAGIAGWGRGGLWRGDGKELFYFADRKLMAVDVSAVGGTFHAGISQDVVRDTYEFAVLLDQLCALGGWSAFSDAWCASSIRRDP